MAVAYGQVFQSHHPASASASASVSMSDIKSKERTEFFFVNVDSNSAYDTLSTFQAICQKIINDKKITKHTDNIGEKLCVFDTVEAMIASYNLDNEVTLMLVGKNCLSSNKHKFTKFTFEKKENPAYMPLYTDHYIDLPLPFRPHRTKSKSGSKLKKVKSKSVKRSRKPRRQ